MFLHQRINDLIKVAGHDLGEFIQCQIDAVVGDSSLGEIIGTYALGAITASYLDTTGFRNFALLARLFLFQQTRLQQ